MGTLAVPLMVAGTAAQMYATGEQGRKAHEAGLTQKALNDVAATQAIAAGQRKGFKAKKDAELLAGRVVALAAMQGASQDIDRVTSAIYQEGEYNQAKAMYEAETDAENIRYEGELAAQKGRGASKAAGMQNIATALSGAASVATYKATTKA